MGAAQGKRGLQWRLGILNGVGGSAVLASYAWGMALAPELRTGLWGGVPDALRPLYTANMLAAAVGYFPFTALLVLGTGPERFREQTGLGYGLLFGLYALILVPSALWLPLTAQQLAAPAPGRWLAIRVVLALVAVGAVGLLAVLVRLARRRGGAWAWAAVAGAVPFATQTALLDALVWPAYWQP